MSHPLADLDAVAMTAKEITRQLQMHNAAPRMLEALENLENDDGAIPPSAWEMVQAAIADAGGTPKGPPETDIRAENAALRQSLAWAINALHGESGCGNNFWEQFPEYIAAIAFLADTQPKEEAP